MTNLIIKGLDLFVHAVLWLVYRPRIVDEDNIPRKGGVLFISNHVSYLDALLIYCFQKRPIRFIAHKDYIPSGFPAWVAKKIGTILIEPGKTRNVVAAIQTARKALANGDAVCLFPEGGITRTGQLRGFEPGVLSFLKGNENVPVVPVWIGGLWGSFFSYTRPAGQRRRPRRLLQRVTLAFGKPIFRPKNVYQLRRAVEELGVDAMNPLRFPGDRHYRLPAQQMIRNCRQYPKLDRLADSTGVRLNGRQTLLRSLVARRVFRRLAPADEKMIGLLLPTSVGGVLANVALTLDGKVPVNLNYTLNNETLDYCCDLTGIKRVITSRKFLQKFPNLKLKAEFVLIEDALQKVALSDKLLGLAESFLPTCCLERHLKLTKVKPDDLLTIVFTSGSTGRPKGAMLSPMNVAANVNEFYQFYLPKPGEKIMGALPLFHSFGFTTTLWCPMMMPLGAVYHYSPLDAKIIGNHCRQENITFLTATATFFRNYLRRCPREDFEHLTAPVAGAEKLPRELADAWKEKYGHEIVEGFGATELSPVLAANLPTCKFYDDYHIYQKRGSIGMALGGLAVRITNPETGEELGPNEPGMLEVKGPTVMLGYYKDPEKTARVIKDGWYSTGDIARIDDDGFIFITGRQQRISKIGGEMVPHVFIEAEIEKILGQITRETGESVASSASDEDSTFDAPSFIVTSVPDERKGEKIVVLFTHLPVEPDVICEKLKDEGHPLLWIPDPRNFHPVESIPILGTGKPDLRKIKETALAIYGIKER